MCVRNVFWFAYKFTKVEKEVQVLIWYTSFSALLILDGIFCNLLQQVSLPLSFILRAHSLSFSVWGMFWFAYKFTKVEKEVQVLIWYTSFSALLILDGIFCNLLQQVSLPLSFILRAHSLSFSVWGMFWFAYKRSFILSFNLCVCVCKECVLICL